MPNVQLLQGPEVLKTLGRHNVKVFGYGLKAPTLMVVVSMAVIFLAMAGTVWWNSHLTTLMWRAIFGVFVAIAAGLASLAIYWYRFTKTHFLATSERMLFVGHKTKMWSVAWPLVDKRALNFQKMQLSPFNGALHMKVAGQDIDVHLFNAFAHLNDIPGFMQRVLEHLPHEPDDPAALEAETDAPNPPSDTVSS